MPTTITTKNKTKLIPKLRFKGFEGEWVKNELGSFANVSKLAGYEFTKHIVYQDEGKIIALRALNIKNNSLDLKDVKYIDNSELSMLNRSKLFIDDLMFTYIGTIGEVALIKENDRYYLAPNVARIRVSKEKVLAKFICQYFNISKFKNIEIKKYIATSSQPSLTMENVRKFEINLPSLSEQQKIATFLSSVDEKIQQLTRKKELLEHYKKGVMQQLFSGVLRFKDEKGKEYEDWEEKRLGEVAEIIMGQSPDSNSYNNDSIGMLLIQGNADINGRVTNPRQWTSAPTKKCEIGDLILTVRAPVGSISKSNHNACIGRGVCAIKNNANSNIEYLYQFFISYEPKWIRIEQGSTFTAVSGTDIKSIKIILPSIEEQQKIAKYLTSIDKKIETIKKEITEMQGFKKGLLQQMFV